MNMNMNINTNRQHYIDILRGIGMIFVVYGHIIRIWPDRSYIWTFHMPLFFFISGLIFQPTKYNTIKAFILRRSIFLLIPYILFYILCVPMWGGFTLLYTGNLSVIDITKEYLLMFVGNMTNSGGALWFLPCLFVTELIYWNINNYFRQYLQLPISLLLMTIGYFLLKANITLPFGINIALLSLPFYSIAYLSKNYIKKWKDKNLTSWIVSLILLFSIQLFLFKYSGLDLALFYIKNIVTYIPMALSGILFYLIISFIINKNFILEWIGKNTLVILAFHSYVYKIILWGISSLTAKPLQAIRADYISCFATTILTILILIPIIKIYNHKVTPSLNQLYNKLKNKFSQ